MDKIIERRRHPFNADQEKFSTQRRVTYILLAMFVGMAINVFIYNDQSERSMVIQTVINFTSLAVGYWIGASKQTQDQAHVVPTPVTNINAADGATTTVNTTETKP